MVETIRSRIFGGTVSIIRVSQSGRNARDADIEVRELLRPSHRHGADAGFRGGVVRLPDIAFTRNARNVDDHALPPAIDHVRDGFARAEKDAAQVDGDDLVEIINGHFSDSLAFVDLHQEAVLGDAGVVLCSEVLFDFVEKLTTACSSATSTP